MNWSEKSSFVGVCGVVLLGVVVAGCAPVQEEEEDSSEAVDVGQAEAVPDVSAAVHALREGDDFKPAALARFGPDVAFGGGKFFVVWNDIREGGVFGTRVKPDGTILDPEGIRINISDASDDEAIREPAIAYNGTHFFVVWESFDGVRAVRVKPDGNVVGPVFDVINSDETFGPVDVACSKDICVVTFTVEGDNETDIFFTRVTKDGEVLDDPDRFLSPGDNFAVDAAVAWSSSKEVFLVVWSDSRGGEGEEDIFGNRVTEDGEILDGDGFPISEADGAQRAPDVAWSGKRFHVVWSDTRKGDADIFGARVRGDGKVDDKNGIPISKASGDQITPRVAHDDSNSLVVWSDTRNDKSRIRGARLEEDGEVKDNGGFAISDGDKPQEFLPAVAAGADRFFTAFAGEKEVDFFKPHFILGTRVTHQGQVKDSPALKLTLEPK
ncbi:hypothetical protein [Hyalangium minutum]|nr:hypothetical protein [Hyalangium minutum]